MPDWTYRTLFRPLLFKLPPERARDLTLSVMGRFCALPLGGQVIDLLGRMAPPEEARRQVAAIDFPSPVGLGAGLDIHALALPALARLGYGFLEVGPVTRDPVRSVEHVQRRTREQALRYPDVPINDGLPALLERLDRLGVPCLPIGFRLAHRSAGSAAAAAELCYLIDHLRRHARFFTLDTHWGAASGRWSQHEWADHLAVVMEAVGSEEPAPSVFVSVSPDLDPQQADAMLAPAVSLGVRGVVVAGGIPNGPGWRLCGAPTREVSVRMVRSLHERWGGRLAIVGSGGICEPDDALRFVEAGASLVQVHSGAVFNGPGLAKRINEAVVYFASSPQRAADQASAPAPSPWVPAGGQPAAEPVMVQTSPAVADTSEHRADRGSGSAWVPFALFGLGLTIYGVVLWLLAASVIVLPHAEALTGLSRSDLEAVNDRLISFMAHNRTSLAGPTISLGIIYTCLAYFPIRRGLVWARDVVRISGPVYFGLNALQMTLGFIDPVRIATLLALLVLYLIALSRPLPKPRYPRPNLRSDGLWVVGQFGQLFFVGVAAAILGVGTTISLIGASSVFVPEDLNFMSTTANALFHANHQLVPLVAHDRASFGAALVTNGLVMLLTGFWGYRQGSRWLWWALLAAWLPAFGSAMGTHYAVGYTDHVHLFPPVLGAAWYLVALVTSFPYLMAPPAPPRRRPIAAPSRVASPRLSTPTAETVVIPQVELPGATRLAPPPADSASGAQPR